MSGRRLSPATIKKEIVTLRTAWNWAEKMGMVTGRFPYHGLRYAKIDEKPPFRPSKRSSGGSSRAESRPPKGKNSGRALFLRTPEIAELLAYAKEHAAHPWIYPMICMAAHTGARRSELIRMQITDIDFTGAASSSTRRNGPGAGRLDPAGAAVGLPRGRAKGMAGIAPRRLLPFCNPAVVERSRKTQPHDRPQRHEDAGNNLDRQVGEGERARFVGLRADHGRRGPRSPAGRRYVAAGGL